MKISPVEAELFYAEGEAVWQTGRQTDRQTEMTNLMVAFLNFANASKNSWESFAVHCYGITVTSLVFHCDVVSRIEASTSDRKFSSENV